MQVKLDLNLKEYNSYNLSAKCAKAFFPAKEEDILNAFLNNPDIKKIILGNGNNIILSKNWYDEHFIIFNRNYDKTEVNGTEIVAECGATMLHLSEVALLNGLSGLEIFFDIPSSVGGAIVMNAGTGEKEIKDLVVKVRYLDLDDFKIKEISKKDIKFEYRNSFFQRNKNKIVLKVWFKLTKGEKENIIDEMNKIKEIRWNKQPREYPNCGSVFKRPKGKYVGPMIEELGLKGYSIGGAMVSEKHAGFIVNSGNASGTDILALIDFIKEKVKEKFEVELEIEQRIL